MVSISNSNEFASSRTEQTGAVHAEQWAGHHRNRTRVVEGCSQQVHEEVACVVAKSASMSVAILHQNKTKSSFGLCFQEFERIYCYLNGATQPILEAVTCKTEIRCDTFLHNCNKRCAVPALAMNNFAPKRRSTTRAPLKSLPSAASDWWVHNPWSSNRQAKAMKRSYRP